MTTEELNICRYENGREVEDYAYWCDCTYKCVGDLKEVKSLYKILKYIDRRKTSIEKNGFGKWWLGNLVTKLGGNWEKYRCRGEITYYELNNNILTICQSTLGVSRKEYENIIEEKFPSIKVYFSRGRIGMLCIFHE